MTTPTLTNNDTALRAISDVTGDNLLAFNEPGGPLVAKGWAPGWDWLVEAVLTADTLETFVTASRSYRERRVPVRGTLAGLPAIAWAQVQRHKGAQRRALSVIDLGDVRVALNEDISDWMEVDR
jgi:hypothetical protein